MSSSPYYSRGLASAYVSGGELGFSERMTKWILGEFYPDYAGKVVDIACGAGEAVRVFREAGWKASGLDKSEAMLQIARERNGRGVTLKQGSMHSLTKVGRGFDLVTCMYDAINCNLSLTDFSTTLSEVHRLLKPNGRFIFDVFTVSGLHRAYDGVELHTRNRDHIVITHSEVDRRKNVGTKELLGASRAADWAPWREVHKVRAYAPKTILRQLKRVGFVEAALYAWPSRRRATAGDLDGEERFVVVCQRGP